MIACLVQNAMFHHNSRCKGFRMPYRNPYPGLSDDLDRRGLRFLGVNLLPEPGCDLCYLEARLATQVGR
eukprot:SAG22_NODE_66_length_22936_cov_626.714279_6_plen_69_part_00